MSKAKSRSCLNCGQPDMSLEVKDVTLESGGRTLVVPMVKGWHCPACGEIEFVGDGSAERYATALDTLAAGRDEGKSVDAGECTERSIPGEPAKRRIAPPGAIEGECWIADDFDAPIDHLFDCLKEDAA